MADINVFGDFNKSGLTKKQLKKTVRAVFFEVQGRQSETNNIHKPINVVFVSAEDIREKNLKYREKDEPTDVLSFDYGDEGDILLCLEAINKYRKNDSLSRAVTKTLIHGALHIYGYDHKSNKDYDIMRKKEKKIIRSIEK